jgi:hypothetical protein
VTGCPSRTLIEPFTFGRHAVGQLVEVSIRVPAALRNVRSAVVSSTPPAHGECCPRTHSDISRRYRGSLVRSRAFSAGENLCVVNEPVDYCRRHHHLVAEDLAQRRRAVRGHDHGRPLVPLGHERVHQVGGLGEEVELARCSTTWPQAGRLDARLAAMRLARCDLRREDRLEDALIAALDRVLEGEVELLERFSASGSSRPVSASSGSARAAARRLELPE